MVKWVPRKRLSVKYVRCVAYFFQRKSVEKVGVLNESERDTPSSNHIKMNSVLIKPEGFIITIIFFHGLGRLTCSGIDALPSFLGASTVSSSSRFVVEGVFRQSGVVHSFKVVDPVLFVSESHVLYSRDLQFFSYDFASYFIQPCVSRNTS